MRPWWSALSIDSDWAAPVPGGLVECLKAHGTVRADCGFWKMAAENPHQNHEQNPKAIFLKFFLLFEIPIFPHEIISVTGLCIDKDQGSRDLSSPASVKRECLSDDFRWSWCVSAWSGEETRVSLHCGNFAVVWVCRHLRHHVFLQTKPSFSCAEARQNLIWFYFCNSALTGKWSVSTGRAQDFCSSTGWAWPWSRKATFTLFSKPLECGSTLQEEAAGLNFLLDLSFHNMTHFVPM